MEPRFAAVEALEASQTGLHGLLPDPIGFRAKQLGLAAKVYAQMIAEWCG